MQFGRERFDLSDYGLKAWSQGSEPAVFLDYDNDYDNDNDNDNGLDLLLLT